MIYMFLAEGFEETEAIGCLDVLKRAEIDVKTVGIGGKIINGAHGITVYADLADVDVNPNSELEGIILPGGNIGTLNLSKSQKVEAFIDYALKSDRLVAAICAAPTILGDKGRLKGCNATCYPGLEKRLTGANYVELPVVSDGNIITASGAGVAVDFALELVRYLVSGEVADSIRGGIQCP